MLLLNGYTIMFGLLICTTALRADSCSDHKIDLPQQITLQRGGLAEYLSNKLQVSVLAEFRMEDGRTRGKKIILGPGVVSMAEIGYLLSDRGPVDCSIGIGFIHFADPLVAPVVQNALNHKFLLFNTRDNADNFLLELRNRLHREAFDPNAADTMAGATGGLTPIDSARFPLKPEIVRDVTARDIFVREAGQQPMSLTIDVPESANDGLAAAWAESEKTLQMAVTRDSTGVQMAEPRRVPNRN